MSGRPIESPTLHGPYLHWTRTVAGKTVTRSLTPDQARRYQTWFDNAHRVRDLLGELEARSLRLRGRRGVTTVNAEISPSRSAERQPNEDLWPYSGGCAVATMLGERRLSRFLRDRDSVK